MVKSSGAPRRSVPAGAGAALPILGFASPRFVVLVIGLTCGNRIAALQPASEIQIGATPGTKGAKPQLLRFPAQGTAANRAKALSRHLLLTPIQPTVSTSKF